MRILRELGRFFAVVLMTTGAALAAEKVDLKYSFGSKPVPGFVHVTPDAKYTIDRGFGFDLESKVQVVDRAEKGSFTTGANPRGFFFSAKVPEGTYQVTVTLGDPAGDSIATIKSETRRLMVEKLKTSGIVTRCSFLVHVRTPNYPGGSVALKDREKLPILYVQWADSDPLIPFLELNWDEKLTLAFSETPVLEAVEIVTAPPHTTVYLVGDSTMTDMMMDPYTSWGQEFPRWFKSPVLIANYAECGESAASFIGERRWAKIMSEIHVGDYVLIQFGINDIGLDEARIRQYFGQYIEDARQKGAIPVLVTSQNLERRQIGNYAEVMRKISKEQNAPLIDLNAMSAKLYQAWGPETTRKAFIDGTHHNNFGAYVLAKCVVQGVIDAKLPWAMHVVDDWKPFDPSTPDDFTSFKMPLDPQLDPARQGGPGTPDGRGPMAGAVQGGRRGGRGAGTTQPSTVPSAR